MLLISTLLFRFFAHPASGWLSDFWKASPTLRDLAKQSILLFRFPNDPALRLLPHDWTLSVEMMLSLLLPILILTTRIRSWLVVLLCYTAAKFLPIDPFIFDFSLGIFIFCNRKFLTNQWKKIPHFGHWFCLILAITLIGLEYYFPAYPKIIDHILIHRKAWGMATLLCILISSEKLQRVFSHPFLIFQGKISYSFYLTHLIILAIIFKTIPTFGFIPAFITVYLLTLLTGGLMFTLVEKPFIDWSKTKFEIAERPL